MLLKNLLPLLNFQINPEIYVVDNSTGETLTTIVDNAYSFVIDGDLYSTPDSLQGNKLLNAKIRSVEASIHHQGQLEIYVEI